MKTKTSAVNLGIMTVLLVIFTSFYGCSKENETTDFTASSSEIKEASLDYSLPESSSWLTSITTLPSDELSEAEAAALITMREEEFLAHDVYLTLAQLYTKPIFKNIAKSEAVHTEAIRKLLVKYNLPDPAANHVTGTFTNPEFTALYNSLVAIGSQSLLSGVTVGATIEDLDIFDLQNHLAEVDNRDIRLVFNNLLNGSKNHLRAFYANIIFLGGSYTPQYITQAEFDAIINQ